MNAAKNGKGNGLKAKADKTRRRSAAAKSAEGGTPPTAREVLGTICGLCREAVAELQTLSGRVESVRKTLWRLGEVRAYESKGDAAAAAEKKEAAAARPSAEGGRRSPSTVRDMATLPTVGEMKDAFRAAEKAGEVAAGEAGEGGAA